MHMHMRMWPAICMQCCESMQFQKEKNNEDYFPPSCMAQELSMNNFLASACKIVDLCTIIFTFYACVFIVV